ncbi:MAG: flagellar export protein FliJ [Thermodesulfobacteriota bacterium]
MFRFRLEFLLRYRRQKEELAMYELAQRVREANQIEGELEDVRRRGRELTEELRERTAQDLPAPVFTLYKDYQEHLRRRELVTERRLTHAESRIEQQRQVLVAASVERKTIERFKERRQKENQALEGRREQNTLDELASLARLRIDHARKE